MADKFEDLLIWGKATEFFDAVNAFLERPVLRKDRDLHDQISDAIDSVISNIPEGFEQPTDKSFAQYLYRSKGSAAEVRGRLFIALRRGYISKTEYETAIALGIELGKMLSGFIKYLIRSNRKRRGTGDLPDV